MSLSMSAVRAVPIILMVFLCWMQISSAVEISTVPSVTQRLDVNDNFRLTTSDAETVYGAITSIRPVASVRDSKWFVRATPEFIFTRYTGKEDLDSEEGLLAIDSEYRQERTTYGINVDVRRESTLTSEVADSGLLISNNNRDQMSFSPYVQHTLSEKSVVYSNASYSDVVFENSSPTGVQDYRYMSASVGYLYQWSEQTRVNASVFKSVFRNPDTFSRTDSIGYRIGFDHNFSQTAESTFSIGHNMSRVNFINSRFFVTAGGALGVDNTKESVRDSGLLLGVGFTKRFPRTTFKGNFDRSLSPSSRGAQSKSDELEFVVEHLFSERLRGVVTGLYANRTSEADQRISLDREFYRARASLHYKISEYWSIVGLYVYRTQSFSSRSQSAEGNIVSLSLKFDHRRFTSSWN